VEEPGLDLHEWETRWHELQEAARRGARPDLAEDRAVRPADARGGGFELDEPVTVEGEDPDIVRDFVAARHVANLAGAGEAEPEDVAVALENLREIYDYVISDRRSATG
jgi:hypothetical protein